MAGKDRRGFHCRYPRRSQRQIAVICGSNKLGFSACKSATCPRMLHLDGFTFRSLRSKKEKATRLGGLSVSCTGVHSELLCPLLKFACKQFASILLFQQFCYRCFDFKKAKSLQKPCKITKAVARYGEETRKTRKHTCISIASVIQ